MSEKGTQKEVLCSWLQPLFDRWTRKTSLELEILFFELDQKQQIPTNKSVSESLFFFLIREELRAKKYTKIVQSKTTDSFIGSYRYTHDDNTGRLLGVMKKVSLGRTDIPFLDLHVGCRMNLKNEEDVTLIAPPFETKQVKMKRRKERTSFVYPTHSFDFTLVRNAHYQLLTREIEQEAIHGATTSVSGLIDSVLRQMTQIATYQTPTGVSSRKRKASTSPAQELRLEAIRVKG